MTRPSAATSAGTVALEPAATWAEPSRTPTSTGETAASIARTAVQPTAAALPARILAAPWPWARTGSWPAAASRSRPHTAASSVASQARLSPAPGQAGIGVPPFDTTSRRVARTATTRPPTPNTPMRMGTLCFGQNSPISASSSSGTPSAHTNAAESPAPSPSGAVRPSQASIAQVGQPAASCSTVESCAGRPSRCGSGAADATGPGSASTPMRRPCRACSAISGRKSTAVGIGSGRIRTIRLRSPCRTATPSATAATHAATRRGSRLGEHAAISAPSRPSHADAVQEDRTLNAARSMNGAARCTSTPPTRPVSSATTSVGAAAQRRPPMTRRGRRRVKRAVASQPPAAAIGSASTQSATIAADGCQNVIEPRTARTAAKGSAGPTKPLPSGWTPQPTLRQSESTVPRGSS
ncbi:hypothetical protein [Amnibacterium kyonggiense]